MNSSRLRMYHKVNPVESFGNLKERVERLFRNPARKPTHSAQLDLGLPELLSCERGGVHPKENLSDFVWRISEAASGGDVYLFGGVLRDLALLGRSGFQSDIDLVVDGGWKRCSSILESLGAQRNKFGGYRLEVSGWPIDVWCAQETWAVRRGIVEYKGVSSLTETTVLNWDAILMNWRTKEFVCRENYLEDLKGRLLDLVLEQNPNPLGTAVRVFRHLCSKDARGMTPAVADYLAECAFKYSFSDVHKYELKSYGSALVDPAVFFFFSMLRDHKGEDMRRAFELVSESLRLQGISLMFKQQEWFF